MPFRVCDSKWKGEVFRFCGILFWPSPPGPLLLRGVCLATKIFFISNRLGTKSSFGWKASISKGEGWGDKILRNRHCQLPVSFPVLPPVIQTTRVPWSNTKPAGHSLTSCANAAIFGWLPQLAEKCANRRIGSHISQTNAMTTRIAKYISIIGHPLLTIPLFVVSVMFHFQDFNSALLTSFLMVSVIIVPLII